MVGLPLIFWFMTLGYVYPETFIVSTLIGILWELFEHYYSEIVQVGMETAMFYYQIKKKMVIGGMVSGAIFYVIFQDF